MNERIASAIIKEHVTSHLQKDERLEDQHKIKLHDIKTSTSRLDFYLPNGAKSLDIQGPAAIEVKERVVSDTLMRLSFAYDNANLAELVFIVLDERAYESLKSTLERLHGSGQIGREIKPFLLKDFLSGHESADYANALIKKGIVNYGEQQNRDALLRELKENIHSNSYTLFFGAGVSCSAGLPGWDELLKGVLRKVIEESGISIEVSDYDAINKYSYCSNSPLIMAQYLSVALYKIGNLLKGKLSEIVRKEIYRIAPSRFDLLDALVDLVKGKRPESVITYNYDDLFETRANSNGIHCHPIADDNRVEGDELPVYHVHGVLYQNTIPNKEEQIVLDERSYHTENKDAFLWSNIEQMHALRRSTCIFVGLSMTDPNLRRLLDISYHGYGDKSAYHYAFLEKKELRPGELKKNNDNQTIIENMLYDLGVTPIWYDTHDDLPDLIRKLI